MPWNKDADNSALLDFEVAAIIARARAEAPLNPTSAVADLWAPLWLVLWRTGRRLGEVLAATGECVRPDVLWFVPLKKNTREWTSCSLQPDVASELAGIIDRHHVGRTDRVFPMTPRGALKAFKRHATGAGVYRPKGVHPHMLRHGNAHHYAGQLMQGGMPPQLVLGHLKKALGHAGYSTLHQYLEPTQREVAAWQARAFTRPPD